MVRKILVVGASLGVFYWAAAGSAQDQIGTVTEDGQGAAEVGGEPARTEPPPAPRKGGDSPVVGRRRTNRSSDTGRDAARKYMAPKNANPSPAARVLYLHFGWFPSDDAYKWGDRDSTKNVGKWDVGVTYRMGEWTNSMDLSFRFDLQSYSLPEGTATKLSFLPVITFPDAASRFPLYFGAGAGLGVFAKQISNESNLALDYQLFAGARFFNLWDKLGFFVEGGLKNHILLFSDGQFNGTFIALGGVFTF